MVRHRCTRCKEDVEKYGIRHKYAGGLFCEDCLRILGVRGSIIRGFWERLWERIKEFVAVPFKPKPVTKDTATRVAYSVMKSKAMGIPPDARTINPQKR